MYLLGGLIREFSRQCVGLSRYLPNKARTWNEKSEESAWRKVSLHSGQCG